MRRVPPRRATVAAGVLAAAVLVAVAAAAGLTGGDGGRAVETEQSPPSTPPPTPTVPWQPAPTPPVSGTIPRPSTQLPELPFAGLPAAGFADVTADGVVLFALDGTELGTGTGWPGGAPAPATDLVVRDDRGVTTVEAASPDPAQVPEGCDTAAGGGGTRLAVCDGGVEIVRVDPAGAQTPLAAAPAGSTWARALPSPDGEWMLTEAVNGCGKAEAGLGATDGSGSVTTVVGDALAEGHAVGWLPDGRAVTQLVGGGCGQAAIPGRVFATEPGGDDAELPISPRGVVHMWARADGGLNDADRTFERARRELGLEACCDGGLHGSDVFGGLVWDGVQVSVTGSGDGPFPGPDLPGLHAVRVDGVDIVVAQGAGGTIATFSCKWTWQIGGEPGDVTDEATVVVGGAGTRGR